MGVGALPGSGALELRWSVRAGVGLCPQEPTCAPVWTHMSAKVCVWLCTVPEGVFVVDVCLVVHMHEC